MKTLLLLIALFLLIDLQIVAQQKKFTPEEEALKKYVLSFGENYSAFGKNKDKEKVLSYMDKDVLGTLVTTDLNNRVTTFDSDLAGFDNHLKGILFKDGLSINYKINNIPRAYISGDAGIVVYEATYEQEKNKEIWSSGDETVAFTLKRDKDKQWKIIHYTTIAFENAKYKGQCFCGVKEVENQHYQTSTTAPAGKGYIAYTHDFTFTNKDQDKIIEVAQKTEKKTMVKVGKKTEPKIETVIENYTFFLTFAGELYFLKGKNPQTGEMVDVQEAKKENGVGVAPNKEEAMMQIIQKYLMPTTCISIKYRQ